MALSTRVWGAGKRLLLGGALVLTYILFAAAAMRLALKTRDVVVPQLGGKTVNEATRAARASRANLKVEEAKRIDPSVPAGQIISQDPQAGVQTRRERSVKVWVSAGPRAQLGAGARRRVRAHGAAAGAAGRTAARIDFGNRSADYPAGSVVAQNPPPKISGGAVSRCSSTAASAARPTSCRI